ncbi:Protein TIFY 8 [Striga hermonthica]|uniref:Protein TIFY n=1 Tax=Striga hermonthica TaxID=68872 RepID=A0A9N7MNZ0_STRHE|nr:Protein TIFY 8 [Striga hermonthica]
MRRTCISERCFNVWRTMSTSMNAESGKKTSRAGSGKNNSSNAGAETEAQPTTFHDFLGNKGQESAPAADKGDRPPPEVSPSSISDLGSERNTGNHLEGIPYYGSRGDISGLESGNRFTGYKRSNSDSFMTLSRDKFPHGPQPDSQDSPLLTKLLRYSSGEGTIRPREEETPFGAMHQMRPITSSFISQSSGRTDTNPSKWNPGHTLQYPPRVSQIVPFGYHQGPGNRAKEANAGLPLVSQTAADEGSRTGIKGSAGILSSIGAAGPISGRQPAGVLITSGKQKSAVSISEPESSTNPGRHGMESGGRQMTIFYGGQAHVFDNVPSNKADVILALAGSNGGSWSTTYNKPNSTGKALASDNSEAALSILRELHARPSDK